MQERRYDVRGDGGVRIAVSETGEPSGPALLLHHGLASSQRIWDLMIPSLARRHRVVTYDARGHGRSGKPSSGFGFGRVSADARAVMRARKLHRPIMVGHSWGAMVALDLAARSRTPLAGAVLIDGGIVPLGARMSWAEAKEALAPPHLAGMHIEDFRGLIRTFFAETIEVTPDVEEIVVSVMRVAPDGRIRPHLRRANHFKILRAIWEQDPVQLHRALRVPTLAIMAASTDDQAFVAAKRDAVASLRRTGSPATFAWMKGIHDLPLQHPEALARRIERFARTTVG